MKHTGQHPHSHEPAPQTSGRTIRWAQHYDSLVKLMLLGRDKTLRRMTAEMAGIRPGDSVLEVGCGTGELAIAAKALAGASGQVHGIDAAPEMIAVARSKVAQAGIDITFRLEPIEALSFADDSFDVVLSSLMMHHLPSDLKRRGLAEIYRVLKPGGHVFILDMKRPIGLHDRLASATLLHQASEMGVQEVLPIMKDIGFVNVQSGDTRFRLLGFVRGEVLSI